MRYAAKTDVSTDRSKLEIERVCKRYGASQFCSGWQANNAMIGFRLHNRLLRFILKLPDKSKPEFQLTGARGKQRDPEKVDKLWELACRQSWRALALVIKAKLEAVESGISTFDSEFMANIVMNNGLTVGEVICPALEKATDTVKELPLLM